MRCNAALERHCSSLSNHLFDERITAQYDLLAEACRPVIAERRLVRSSSTMICRFTGNQNEDLRLGRITLAALHIRCNL